MNNDSHPDRSSPSSSSFPVTATAQIAYQNPTTGISLTRQQLDAYAKGEIVNEKGDVVFFKPGFVVDDPWAEGEWRREKKMRRGGWARS